MEDQLLRSAGRVLLSVLLVLSAFLIGLAGFGFLLASAVMTLSLAVGPQWAALLFGLGLMLLAVGCLALAKGRRSRPIHAGTDKAPTRVDDTDAAPGEGADESSALLMAFTVAFVFARYLDRRKRC